MRLDLLLRMDPTCLDIRTRLIHLALEPDDVFAILLSVVAHEFAHDLRGGSVGMLRRRHKRVAQLRFELHRENGFLGHGEHSDQR